MSFTAQTLIAGSRISFKAGGVPETPATFVDGDRFGVIDKGSVEVATTDVDLKGYKAGNPGVRVLVDSQITETTVTIKFTSEQLDQLTFDLGFALDGSGNIYGGAAQKKGWLKYELFNVSTGIKTCTAYGVLSLDGNLEFGDGHVKPGFKFKVLNGTVSDPV